MVKKQSLSIHIELYIICPFPNNKYWRTFFSFFHLRKVILPVLVSLGSKGKGFGFEKGKKFSAEGKKVCSYAHAFPTEKSQLLLKIMIPKFLTFLIYLWGRPFRPTKIHKKWFSSFFDILLTFICWPFIAQKLPNKT